MRLLKVLVVVPLVGGCTVSHPLEPSPASAIPVVSPDLEAPKNALPISIVRPRDSRPSQEVHRFAEIGGPMIATVHSFKTEADAGVWVGNGLTAGLENAGYRVEHIEKTADAKTPIVLTLDVTWLSAQDATQHLIVIGCDAKLDAQVKIFKGVEVVFDRAYEGQSEASGGCTANTTRATTKALENLLDKAVPEIASLLSRLTRPAVPVADIR